MPINNANTKDKTAAEISNQWLIDAITNHTYSNLRSQFKSDREMADTIKNHINNVINSNEFKSVQKDIDKLSDTYYAYTHPDNSGKKEYFTAYYNTLQDMNKKKPVLDYRIADMYCKLTKIPDAVRETMPESAYLFNKVKESMISSGSEIEKKLTIGSETAKNLCDTDKFLETAHKTIDEMLTLLRSGDSKLRGSSDAYKDIKNELKHLKSTLEKGNLANQRRFMVTMSVIAEKANNYVADRKEVSEGYSLSSYKGKRVNIMRTIQAKCSGIFDYNNSFANMPAKYTNEVIIESSKLIKKDLAHNSFSKQRYNYAIIDLDPKSKNSAGKYVLDYRELDTMSELFKGKKIRYKDARKVQENLIKFNDEISKMSIETLNEKAAHYKEPVKNINLLDDMIYESPFLDASEITKIVNNYKLEKVNAAIEAKNKNITMENNAINNGFSIN